MFNIATGIIISAFAGMLFLDNQVFAAIMSIIAGFLFAIGYFDMEKEHKKSAK